MEEKIIFTQADVSKDKVHGILAYLGILVLVPLLAAKDSQYARFHANQGLVLFIVEIALSIISKILSVAVIFVPILNAIVSAILGTAVGIISLVFLIIGIINACSGEPKKLPIIGNITLIK